MEEIRCAGLIIPENMFEKKKLIHFGRCYAIVDSVLVLLCP